MFCGILREIVSRQLWLFYPQQLLGELLLDRHNFTTMTRYINNPDNLKLMMNMLREKSRNIQFEAFHVFKVRYLWQKPRIIMIVLVNGLQTHSLHRDHLHDFDVGLGHFEWTIKIQSLFSKWCYVVFSFLLQLRTYFFYSLANNKL